MTHRNHKTKLALSVFSKTKGILTKRISLNDEGELEKDVSSCAMSHGSYQRQEVSDLGALNVLLDNLDPNQAVAYGIANSEQAVIVSKNNASRKPAALTRTKDNFRFPSPALFMIDYDPVLGSPALSPDDLHDLITEAIPELAEIAMLQRASASSCIYRGDKELTGVSGQRLYFAVDRGEMIPELGKILAKRLWPAGHGYIALSRSGSMLVRCPVDTCVWQPERLDFAAGAVCVPPLERRPVPGKVFKGTPILDTSSIKPLTEKEEKQYQKLEDNAKEAIKPEQREVREQYVTEQINTLAGPNADEEKRTAVEKTVRDALENHTLTADFVLHLDNYDEITVGEVLADKQKYDGETLADPLEPEYGGGFNKAKLFLSDRKPVIHSFAHGGRVFNLFKSRARIQLGSGRFDRVIEEMAAVLAEEPDLFHNDAGIILVNKDLSNSPRMQQVNVETLTARLASCARFYVLKKGRSGEFYEVEQDPPPRPISTLAKRQDHIGLRPLQGIITAPTLRLDGSLLQEPGYDERSSLLLSGKVLELIPEKPCKEDVEKALEKLLAPFRHFDFESPLDQAVLLSALLTAVVRRTLPTAPGYIITATTKGSGKTKLAQCIDILAGGSGATNAFPRDNEEIRKSLISSLLEGTPSILYDNITGKLHGDLLCAVLSSSTHSDRIIGSKERARLSTGSMFLFTGNNLEPAGDLSRRILRIRLDPICESPWQRHFDFEPVSMVREHRMDLTVAALTLLCGYIAAGRPAQVESHTGSFEEWSKLIRQTVIWQGFEDPEKTISDNHEFDPDTDNLRYVIKAWRNQFGTERVSNKHLRQVLRNPHYGGQEPSIEEAFGDVLGPKKVTVQPIGKWLGYRKGRVVDGLRFESCRVDGDRGWRLVEIDSD